jgi:single-strand DNA-binding protein
MNKVILLGRLTKDPEIRYTQSAEPIAVAKYSLAVNKRYKKQGENDAEFIDCVAFGKPAEFAQKYYSKGQMVSVIGHLQSRSWDDKQTGQKHKVTEVVIEEQYFAESKNKNGNAPTSNDNATTRNNPPEPEPEEDDLPF